VFEPVLVANRDEIARRIIGTVQRMGLRAIAVYSEADADLPFTVTPFYDPLMAKLCVFGETRAEVLERAREAVASFQVEGPKNNLPFCAELLDHLEFADGSYDTGLVSRMRA
jgi:acetyl/propionyl-CoA carboxylase alpha subunit